MARRVKGVIGVWIAGSLMFGSTVATASPAAPNQASPWAVLSVMSGGAPAAAMCGAAAATATAQAPTGCVLPALDAAPPPAAAPSAPLPPPPVPPISAPSAGLGLGINPLLLGLLAVAAGIGIYCAVRHHGNSPS